MSRTKEHLIENKTRLQCADSEKSGLQKLISQLSNQLEEEKSRLADVMAAKRTQEEATELKVQNYEEQVEKMKIELEKMTLAFREAEMKQQSLKDEVSYHFPNH